LLQKTRASSQRKKKKLGKVQVREKRKKRGYRNGPSLRREKKRSKEPNRAIKGEKADQDVTNRKEGINLKKGKLLGEHKKGEGRGKKNRKEDIFREDDVTSDCRKMGPCTVSGRQSQGGEHSPGRETKGMGSFFSKSRTWKEKKGTQEKRQGGGGSERAGESTKRAARALSL